MSDKKDNNVYIDHLEELKSNQFTQNNRFSCISFLSPEGIKNCKLRGVRISGMFSRYEEAKKYAEEIIKSDPYFDVYILEEGKWCPWNDKDKVQDQEYNNKELNDLMKAYKENKDKSDFLYEQRKNEMKKGKYQKRLNQQKIKRLKDDLGQTELVSERQAKREVEQGNGVILETPKEYLSEIKKEKVDANEDPEMYSKIDAIYKEITGDKNASIRNSDSGIEHLNKK